MKIEKRLSSIDHIGILVEDLDKAVTLFHDLFEMDFEEPHDNPEADIRETIEPYGINFYEPLAPERSKTPGVMAKQLERTGGGIVMLSLKVSDLEEGIADMEAKGIKLILKLEQGGSKYAIFHPRNTFGIVIELCEYKEKHPAMVAHS